MESNDHKQIVLLVAEIARLRAERAGHLARIASLEHSMERVIERALIRDVSIAELVLHLEVALDHHDSG